MGDGVERVPIREGRLRGTLFIPSGPGPFPAVVDLFGGVGGLVEYRAALMASHGIMSLHLAYFRFEDLPTDLDEIDLHYFEEGVDFLLAHPKTKGSSVGVVGVSKGAELALIMSACLPPHKLGAVVSINGFHYVYWSKVRYNGRVLPSLMPDLSLTYFTPSGALVFDRCALHVPVTEDTVIKVEHASAQFLLLSAEGDQQIPPWCSDQVIKRLQRFNKSNYQYFRFGPDVGHLIEPCHSPSFCESYHRTLDMILAWGGKKRAHARAQEQSWPAIVRFLHDNLGGTDITSVKSKL